VSTDSTVDMARIQVAEAGPDQAADLADAIHEAFAARPTLDPPAPALTETASTVAAQLADGGGLVASVGARWSADC
jgi:tRNA threonylcarbamoyladenosine biosynthesis protein TsaE